MAVCFVQISPDIFNTKINTKTMKKKKVLYRTLSMNKIGSFDDWIIYPLVNQHSNGKWPFTVDFPIKNGDFP